MKYVILFLIVTIYIFGVDIKPPNYKGKIKFIKQVELKFHFDQYGFSEISDLAYDKTKAILYMVSDEGILYKFRAKFYNNDFKLTPLNATYFKRKSGKRLRSWKRDTEGIALDGNKNIYISREGKPRVTQFNPNGLKIKNLKIPDSISKAKLRSKNKSLESLAYHPKYGLLTAFEWPPKGIPLHYQTIYSLKGEEWHFMMEPYKKSGISEIEVMEDGNILVLERAYNGFFGKFVITLKKVYLNRCDKNKLCQSRVLLKIDSAKDWHVENFEGVTRVEKNRYLMVSDDNRNFFQQTLLIYFEIRGN